MNVLVIGSGGREHALVHKIAQSSFVKKVFAAPGNTGMTSLAECVPLKADDIQGLVNFAKAQKIALTVVGPEQPLTQGIVDAFAAAGLACFGPSARASLIEGSKVYIKEFCTRHKIPTAPFVTFTQAAHAQAYIEELDAYPVVIKADGLAQGKGVVVAQNKNEALQAIDAMLVKNKFGSAGHKIVIEDFLPGQEASFIVLTDGENFVDFPAAQDHKRVFDGDQGPNTGGMGAYAPAPLITQTLRDCILNQIVHPTLVGLREENRKFVGFLYVGLMIDAKGKPFVIEYNCRLGDPETQVLLPLLDEDLVTLMQDALQGKLKTRAAKTKPGAAVTVVMASGGYPEHYETGFAIDGLQNSFSSNVTVYHAGTQKQNEVCKTAGGRVLAVSAVAGNLQNAIRDVYDSVQNITWPHCHYRRDIGQKGLKA